MSVEQTRLLGEAAFQSFKLAVETGEESTLLSLVDEDLRFSVPLPFDEWLGEQRGRERLGALIHFEREEMQLRIGMTATNMISSDQFCCVEFHVSGRNRGGKYENDLVIVFEFADEKIVRLREYTGQLDPKAISQISSH